MLITGRRIQLVLALFILGTGVWGIVAYRGEWLTWVVVALGVAILITVCVFDSPIIGTAGGGGRPEPDEMQTLDALRRKELVRGTSLYLRELNYRYSVRLDPTETGEHRCFTAEVNGVKLGFVPVLITDNSNDRQGYGFVAFVHDGKRWRGPGLPCPSGQVEAVRHAAKCVSPLATEEETRF
jgi:hypothetical protein